jgi:PadR family transcriptional regulator AphA
LLGFLYGGEDYGYDLHQHLTAEFSHVWHISQSQTYSILKRLVKQGYVSSTTQEQEKLPTRQVLSITAVGRRRFEDWLETPTGSSVRAIRLEFISRLYFAQKLAPERLQPMFETQAAEIKATLDRLERSQANLPAEQTFNRLSLQLRTKQLRAVLGWLDECHEILSHNF